MRSNSYHHPFHPHTHAHLDLDCMICFFMDLLLGFTTYRMQVCMVLLPYLVPHKNFIFCREEKKAKITLERSHTH